MNRQVLRSLLLIGLFSTILACSGGTGDDGGGNADAGTATGDGGGDTPDATVSPGGFQVGLLTSSRVVLESDDNGVLQLRCVVLQDGLPYDDVASVAISWEPSTGVTDNGDSFTFDQAGVWTATCDAEAGGEQLRASVDIAVLNEALDPTVAKLGEGIGAFESALFDVMAADGKDDQVLIDAAARMDSAIEMLDPVHFVELDDLLREVPGGYPDASALQAAGIESNADDNALIGELDVLAGELAALRATLGTLDPGSPNESAVAAVDEHTAAIQSAAQALRALNPSAHGWLGARTRLAQLLRDDMAPTMRASAQYIDQVIESEASGVVPKFGFLGLTLGMFNSSNLQVYLVQEIYGPYLAEIDKSINNLIALDLIDYFFPPNPQGPIIEFLQASASLGFATPDYPSWIDGRNFNEDPEYNLIIVVGDGWQTVVDNIFNACGIEDADTVPEAVDTMASCIQDVIDAVDNSMITPLSVESPGLFGSQQGVDLGPFPQACSGPLPIAIGLIPINLGFDRGPAYTINCIN